MKKSLFLVFFFLYLVISNGALLREETIGENRGEKWKEINFGGKKNELVLFVSLYYLRTKKFKNI